MDGSLRMTTKASRHSSMIHAKTKKSAKWGADDDDHLEVASGALGPNASAALSGVMKRPVGS